MQPIQPQQPPEPRKDLIVRACDFIDLQAGFIRVDRPRAERILNEWRMNDQLTFAERVHILNRYDPS